MTPSQQEEHEDHQNMTPSTDNDPSTHSHANTEAHFVLHKPDPVDDGDAEYVYSGASTVHLADRADSFVASQLAAQLLPEIQRPDP